MEPFESHVIVDGAKYLLKYMPLYIRENLWRSVLDSTLTYQQRWKIFLIKEELLK